MELKLPLLIALFLLITACGKSAPGKHTFKEMEPFSPEIMQQVINQQFIACPGFDQCPSGIGRMFAMSTDVRRQSISCTAVLIGPDLVLTNSHCAYTGRSNLEHTCNSIYFSFPGSYGTSQGVRCSKILWRDKRQYGQDHYTRGDNDFALIRLNRALSITPVKLAKAGMLKGRTVYPTVMDQIDGNNARIVKLTCKVKHLSEKFGVANLENCPIISGNSGSAVLDENQNLVGLVFASSNIRVRTPTDELDIRRQGNSTGMAYSIDHIERVLGDLLN